MTLRRRFFLLHWQRVYTADTLLGDAQISITEGVLQSTVLRVGHFVR
jgi:hypothetical protein